MTFAYRSSYFFYVNTPWSHEGEAKNGGIVRKRAVGVKCALQPKTTIIQTHTHW